MRRFRKLPVRERISSYQRIEHMLARAKRPEGDGLLGSQNLLDQRDFGEQPVPSMDEAMEAAAIKAVRKHENVFNATFGRKVATWGIFVDGRVSETNLPPQSFPEDEELPPPEREVAGKTYIVSRRNPAAEGISLHIRGKERR